jgi:pimeloyl-ACP methyl ester carboxylesterase
MTKHVILIHGTWCNGDNWGEFATELQAQGYVVHTPTFRFHGHPSKSDIWGNAQNVRTVGLLDYVADLKALADSLDSEPIIVGHSIGALLAQLLAARVRSAGVVLLGPAPTWGMLPLSRSMISLWGRYLPQWIMSKPMYPVSFKAWSKYICNTTPADISEAYYSTLSAESGTAYRQMVLWYTDPSRAAKVDFEAVDAPVLIITGSEDKCTHPRIGKVTAKKYGKSATYIELEGSDHMMTTSPFMRQTLNAIRDWARTNGSPPLQEG